jgi:hypothetical protein
VYTLLMWHLLAAQEKMVGRLDGSGRDAYCADAVRTVGHVFGTTPMLPATHAELRSEYAGIIVKDLTVTPEALEVFRRNRLLRIRGVPMDDLVTASAGLLDPEVAEIFGIDRSLPAVLPRIDLAAATDDDLLPLACLSRRR